MAKKISKKKSKMSVKKSKAAEESSEVEGSDQGEDDEEEVLAEVVYPSTLTRADKLLRIQRFMTVKPKKKEETDDKNNLGNDSDTDDEEKKGGEESNKVNQSVQWETLEMIFKYQHSLWVYGLILIFHFVDQYLTFQCSFMLGEWAENKLLKTDKSAFIGHVFKILAYNIVNILFRQIRNSCNEFLIDGLMMTIKDDILSKIMRAPVNLFFDVTPNATIMKRFNGEMHEIAGITHRALWIVREVISIMVTIAMLSQQNFMLVFALIPFFYQVWSIQNFAMRSYKEMGRFLDKNFRELGVCQGELFSGSQMIRAMGTQDYAMKLNADGLNLSILTWQVCLSTFQWYSLAVKRASMILTFVGALQMILGRNTEADPVLVVLLFQKVLGIGHVMCGMIHTVANFEKSLINIQKVFRFLSIDSEKLDQARHTDKNWPSKGALEIKDLRLRYRPTTDVVLKGLNVTIKAGEKIGVVGRTGAGKSTLANALTRIVEPLGGSIIVDGVNINNINLQQVRESITIIPQDPTLFKGTIRFNCDPTEQCTDEEIRKVLEEAEVDKLVLKKKDEDEKKKKENEEKFKEH